MTDPDTDHLRRRGDRDPPPGWVVAAWVGAVWLVALGLAVWAAVEWS